MSAMERSLRRALEAGDATDPAFRESIYSASERALERMLAQKNAAEDVALAQRTRLAETINRVEDEFYERQAEVGAAEDGPAQYDPELSLDPAYADAHGYAARRDLDVETAAEGGNPEDDDLSFRPVLGERDAQGRATPVALEVDPFGDETTTPISEPVRLSRRAVRKAGAEAEAPTAAVKKPRRFMLVALLLALLVAVGLYLAYATGGGEGTAENADAGWIRLFDGQRLEALSTPNGGRVEALQGRDGAPPSVRFTSAGEASDMKVAVGAGVVSRIDGRPVMVELVAGSPDGNARTFAVECRLGSESVCGRKVFTTARDSETFAFQMDVPPDAGAGTIAIASVPGGSSESFDLYSLRLKIS